MARKSDLGEFEHLVLLAALRLEADATAPKIAALLEERAGREMSRGTLYAALDRLGRRGFVVWRTRSAGGQSSGRSRCFLVTDQGLNALSRSRTVLLDLWSGVEKQLERGR
jgi:DNA-binding PadR family transcriptional regulator